jgi:DNA polymerase III delta subunit
MIIKTEQALKKELSLPEPRGVYLLFGEDSALLSACRRRILARLCDDHSQPERIDGKKPDIGRLAESLALLPMLGGRRIVSLEDLDPEQLSGADCTALCAVIEDIPQGACLLLTAREGAFDTKKGACAKKLLAAADRAGAAVGLPRRTGQALKNTLRDRCRQRGCDLSAVAAGFLIERCGDDMGRLLNECDKLCAWANGEGPITEATITAVCPPSAEGDVYALSRIMLRGDAPRVVHEVNTLLLQRQPVALLLYHLSAAFCDLARAGEARAAGRTSAQAARDFDSRFAWRMERAFRDSEQVAPRRVFAVCEILLDAEQMLKGSAADERVVLETAVVRSLAALSGDEPC